MDDFNLFWGYIFLWCRFLYDVNLFVLMMLFDDFNLFYDVNLLFYDKLLDDFNLFYDTNFILWYWFVDFTKVRRTVQSTSFQGCFSNFRIDRGNEDYRTILFSQAPAYNNVVFDTCSL